jgi:nitrile hydratase subunit beta
MRHRFDVGDRVQVLELSRAGHVRTPHYVRKHVGTVLHRCGSYLNPERLAVGDVSGPVIPLYRVTFCLCELWSEYEGNREDLLCIEIYDHWLTAAPKTPTDKRANEYFELESWKHG